MLARYREMHFYKFKESSKDGQYNTVIACFGYKDRFDIFDRPQPMQLAIKVCVSFSGCNKNVTPINLRTSRRVLIAFGVKGPNLW